jgi:hypothetical protein
MVPLIWECAGPGLEFHLRTSINLKGKCNRSRLSRSQLVRRRLDLGEEELVVTESNQIWPSRPAAPGVLDQIPQHFDDRSGRKYLDELPATCIGPQLKIVGALRPDGGARFEPLGADPL